MKKKCVILSAPFSRRTKLSNKVWAHKYKKSDVYSKMNLFPSSSLELQQKGHIYKNKRPANRKEISHCEYISI